MSDLIYRQDAIDAVLDRMDVEKWGRNAKPEEIRWTLERLPSAQLEQRWIPCDETIEIPNHEVLTCDKYGKEIIGYLEYADEQWICASEDCVMYDPIAWMKKPEPYRVVEE